MDHPPEEIFSWVDIETVEELESFFLSVIPKLRAAARQCGYGLGVHGSLRRDLDLIATPWVEEYCTKHELACALHKAACGLTQSSYEWGYDKPHGRITTTMPICWVNFKNQGTKRGSGYIDLSIVGYGKEREIMSGRETN